MDVRLPSGKIIRGVPDGTTRSEIRQRLLAAGFSDADIDGPQPAVDPTEGMSGGQKFAAGVGKSLVDTGRGVKQLFNIGDQDALQQTIADERELTQPLRNTGAGTAGEVTGQIAQILAPGGLLLRGAKTAALGRALVAPKTYRGAAGVGAGFGAVQPSLSDGETAMNVGTGTLGGALGQGAVNAIGRVARPIQGAATDTTKALARALEDRGIKLSAAQITDSRPLKFLESAFANMPFTAGREAKRALEQNQQFTRAALKSVGENADEATPEVLEQAHKRLGETFQVLSNIPKVKLGDDFLNRLTELDTATAEVRGMVDTGQIDRLIAGSLDKLAKGELSGKAAQTIRSELTKEARAAAASNPRLAHSIKQVRDGIDDAMRDQLTPAQREAWDVARGQYAALKTIERAMSKTTETASRGFVSPAALGDAVRAGDRAKFPRATGELATLARAGSGTIKPPPTSGTAERELMIRLLTGGGLGGAGVGATAATGDPTWAALGAGTLFAPKVAQSVLYSAPVQKYLAEGAGSVTKAGLARALKAPLPAKLAPRVDRIINSSLPDEAKRRIIASTLRSATVTGSAVTASEPKRP